MDLTVQNASQAKVIEWPEKLQCLFWPQVNELPVRYRVLYGGRGGSKSWGMARALVVLAAKRPLRILCARELQNSIRDSVPKILSDQIESLGLLPFYQIEQARIFCPSTGSEFSFEGIRNNVTKIKSYEGVDICWVEEANKVTKNSWEVLIPTIRKEGSEIWVSFNPELESDDTYQRFVLSPPKNAVVQKISWRDNPWFPQVLKQEMLDLKSKDRDAYLHVWEGECRKALEGAVYAEELRDCAEEGRITHVPHHSSSTINIYWDLGRSDHTAIIFEQYVGMQRRIIDYYQNRLKGLDHYIHVLRTRRSGNGELYEYGTCWLPHDARAKTLGSKKSIEEQMRDAGFRVRIVPRLSKFDGIIAARSIFPTCWFDAARCEKELLHALRHYHYEENSVTEVLSAEPVHDWSSHAADAFRYMAIASSEGANDSKARRVAGALKKHSGLMGRVQEFGESLGWLG